MKQFTYAFAAMGILMGAAHAQSMNKEGDAKQTSPGATGAMGNASNGGVATDPGGVAAQQGDSGKSSGGTVGAAPGADTNSQKPKQ